MLSASEIHELEKKVFQYRLKKTIRKSTLFIVIGFVLVGISIVYNEMTKSETPVTVTQAQIVEEKVTTSAVPQQKEEPIVSQKDDTVKEISTHTNNLPPQMMVKDEPLMLKSPSVNMGKDSRKNTNYLPPPKQEEIKYFATNKDFSDEPVKKNISKQEENFYRASEERIDTAILAPPPFEDTKPKGVIKIETSEVNSIQYLKEKFEKTNNIIFALMLAEEFYTTKNYTESSKWALIANQLDPDSEKSWLWFAKSKLKLGQKEDAIVALKAYLKTNKSKAAQTLLNQISLGEINE